MELSKTPSLEFDTLLSENTLFQEAREQIQNETRFLLLQLRMEVELITMVTPSTI